MEIVTKRIQDIFLGEYEEALEGDTDICKEIIKFGELNKLAYEDLILAIDTSSSVGNLAFKLVCNSKSLKFPEGTCKVGWDKLVNKYAPCNAMSLLKLTNEFHNSKLD